MSGTEAGGSGVEEAIRMLLEALRAEGVSVIDEGLPEIADLSPDQRLLLAALGRAGPRARGSETETSGEPTSSIPEANPETSPIWSETEAVAKEDPAPQNLETHECMEPLLEMTEDPLVAGKGQAPMELSCGAKDAWEQGPVAADQASQNETVPEAPQIETVEPPEAAAMTEGLVVAEPEAVTARRESAEDFLPAGHTVREPDPAAQHSAYPAIVENLVEVPQPGGVPMIPPSATAQLGAAVMPLETVKKTIYLKNARMNEPYVGLVDVPGLRQFRLLDDGGTGLKLDEEAGTLTGLPGVSGDFVVRVQGLVADRSCVVLANLAVIPDPRSLWISKPHDPTAPFAKDDEDSGMSRGDLLCVAASKRGRSHAQEGLFRDDDFALWTGGADGWNIAVVADGAGSAKYSRRGSQIAVKTIVRDLPRLLEEHMTGQIDGLVAEHLKGVEGADGRIRTQLYLSLAKAAFNASMAISEEATKIGDRVSAFSTTLVLSVARKGPNGWFIAGFSIGDGGAAIFDLPSRTVFPLMLADSGEFAGQTRFLQRGEFNNAEDVAKRLFFNVRDSFTAVLTMTDGITDPKFPTDTAFASSDVWCSFWETDLSQSVVMSRDNASLEGELLAWLDFWSPGNHDDRTIAIMLP